MIGDRSRVYYGWVMVGLAAAAMVGTLPGRTQGLGLITEPLLADLQLGRVDYAQLNLWATLLGSGFALGIGRVLDRLGTRGVLTTVVLALGVVVCVMAEARSFWALAVAVTLTRGLGQSALSVISIAMDIQQFQWECGLPWARSGLMCFGWWCVRGSPWRCATNVDPIVALRNE